MKKIIFSAVVPFFLLIGCAHYMDSSEGTYTPPSIKNQPRLFYPRLAQEKSYTGTPKVLLYISPSGIVEKASVLKSCGIGILDSAAASYCKSFIFNPALRNGEPTNSRMAIDVKFTFSKNKWDAMGYIEDVLDLYNQLKVAYPDQKNNIETDILEKHNEYIQNMKDVENFNSGMQQILLPEISSQWSSKWDSYPLTFLLYYDFLQRFPDYYNIDNVKELFSNSLKADVQYIKISPVVNNKDKKEKENLLGSIKSFVTTKYPELLDGLELNSRIDTTSIF